VSYKTNASVQKHSETDCKQHIQLSINSHRMDSMQNNVQEANKGVIGELSSKELQVMFIGALQRG